MSRSLKMTAQRSHEPICLEAAKMHLRVSGAEDDDYIAELIKTAREKVEADTRRAIVQADYEMVVDTDERIIKLPMSPLIELLSVAYKDKNGQWVEYDEGAVTSEECTPAVVCLPRNYYCGRRVVKIAFRAGLAGTGSSPRINITKEVPNTLVLAMKLLISHWYDNRSAITVLDMKYLPLGYEALISRQIVYGV